MIRPLVVAALALVATVGCSGGGGAVDNPFAGGPQGDRSIRIEIQNLNFNDATVHAIRGTQRVRLGRITGKTDDTFTLAWSDNFPLQIEIDLLAGGRCVTRAMDVAPGEIVQVQIPSNLESNGVCL